MTRTLRFVLLDVPVRVESSCDEVADRLATCYGTAPGHDGEGEVTMQVRRRVEGWIVGVAGRVPVQAGELETAVRAANHELMHGVMLARLDLFFVHAAVVAVGGRAIALPGLSQAGKSTLALALLQGGARYLSDELLVYDPGADRVLAFARAPKVRDVCTGYFPQLAERFVGRGEARFLPLGALPSGLAEPARLRMVVVPRWSPEGDDRPRPIGAGEAVLQLVQSALNFGSQRQRGIDHLTRMAAGAHHWCLAWSRPQRAAAAVLAELERGG